MAFSESIFEKMIFLHFPHNNDEFSSFGDFFRGGVADLFPKWSISSYIRVQITRKSVWLIPLIHLNMFRIHIVSWKSVKKISATRFRLSVLKNCLKIAFFGLFKAFISNFLYYNLHWWKLKVITRPQYALRFFIWPLDFPLGSCEDWRLFKTPYRKI